MILVTGGTGFLGSNLLRALVQAGKPVRALYRREIPSQLDDIKERVEWVKGDITDIFSLEDALVGIQQVYHCAAIVSFQPGAKERLFKINIEGTANVVNMCLDAGVKKLVHVSSVAALGRAKENETITEKAEWVESSSNSQYAISKYLGEMEVWRGMIEGLPAAIVNPSIILGSHYWHEGPGQFFQNAWKEFPYYTTGINGFVDVMDVVRSMMLLMDSDVKGQRFILSADNWTYKDIFTTIAQQLDKKPPHISVKPWMAALVWRMEKVKQLFTGKKPLITRETARTAQLEVFYDNTKLPKFLPGFSYTPLEATISRIASDFKQFKARQ